MLQSPSTAAAWLDIAEKIATIAAVLVGGFWVYLNTLRGRVYKPKLQVRLHVTRDKTSAANLLRVQIQIENKGLRQVHFDRDGTSLTLRFAPTLPSTPLPLVVDFKQKADFDILLDHASIEPGLTITEETLVQLPSSDVSDACALALNVAAHHMSWSCTAALGEQLREATAQS